MTNLKLVSVTYTFIAINKLKREKTIFDFSYNPKKCKQELLKKALLFARTYYGNIDEVKLIK